MHPTPPQIAFHATEQIEIVQVQNMTLVQFQIIFVLGFLFSLKKRERKKEKRQEKKKKKDC